MAFEIRNEIFAVNEIHSFISFTVADQDAPQQLSRIHDVDGTYYWTTRSRTRRRYRQ